MKTKPQIMLISTFNTFTQFNYLYTMKHTPKYQDPQHIEYIKKKYGPLNRTKKKEIVPNYEGQDNIFMVFYVLTMVIYIIHLVSK